MENEIGGKGESRKERKETQRRRAGRAEKGRRLRRSGRGQVAKENEPSGPL